VSHLNINREPTSGSVVDHYHQLILLNAAHQITTLLPVISTLIPSRCAPGGMGSSPTHNPGRAKCILHEPY
jgi:hypothetical protein